MDEVVNEGLIVGEGEVDLNMPDPPRQVDFEDKNGQDGAKAMEYSRTLVMEFNPSEVEFWFMQIENEMYTCEVKSQWLKRSILVKNLPPKIQNDVKTLLTIKQSQAPADIYKKIKQEVLRIHAPRKEDKFKKALSRVLTGLPSQLGQTLITDVCVNQGAKLVGCCCAHIVYTLWTLQLPVAVRSHVADMTFSADTYQTVFESADKVFLSTKPTEVSAVVASVSAPQADSEPAQVAAAKPNNRGQRPWYRGGRGGRGRGGGQSQGQDRQNSKGDKQRIRHKSNPSSKCCDNHYRWAADAWFCLSPLTCPMKDKCAPKPAKKEEK